MANLSITVEDKAIEHKREVDVGDAPNKFSELAGSSDSAAENSFSADASASAESGDFVGL